jgi:hypothetical protein
MFFRFRGLPFCPIGKIRQTILYSAWLMPRQSVIDDERIVTGNTLAEQCGGDVFFGLAPASTPIWTKDVS